MTIFADNTRRSLAEKCLRKRWWLYEYKGRGIQRVRTGRDTFALTTGTGVHTLIEEALRGQGLAACVASGVDVYRDVRPDDDRGAYLVDEQKALIEALGRAWYATCYAQFVATYEVLAIEREETVELAPGVQWMSRPDLQVRRKADGALFIINMKTTKRADDRWRDQWPIDQQTLSEVVAVEARLNNEQGQKCEALGEVSRAASASPTGPECAGITGGNAVSPAPVKLSGVIILGLVKGDQLEYPKGSGQWYHNNPLIWAWHNESGKPHPLGDWSARYEWTDPDGSNHRLGKGWVKREVWLHYEGGVASWVEKLATTDPAILHETVVQLPPILRNEQQVAAWRHAVHASEDSIRKRRERVQRQGWNLDTQFPMSTSSGNCLWPRKCECFALCHENADPDDESVWQARSPNHPQELVQLEVR